MTIMAYKGKNKPKPRRVLKAETRPASYDLAEKHRREKAWVKFTLIQAGGKIKQAAESAKEKYGTFWRKCQRHDLLDFAKQLRKGRKQ